MKRVEKLTERLKEKNVDGILLISDSNIPYITGFTGPESYVVVSKAGRGFITDSRYTEQAEAECEDFEIIRWRSPAPGLVETIQSTCEKYGITRLGFEKTRFHMNYMKNCRGTSRASR